MSNYVMSSMKFLKCYDPKYGFADARSFFRTHFPPVKLRKMVDDHSNLMSHSPSSMMSNCRKFALGVGIDYEESY